MKCIIITANLASDLEKKINSWLESGHYDISRSSFQVSAGTDHNIFALMVFYQEHRKIIIREPRRLEQ